MSRSNTPPTADTPHLVSLVLHSKKALQHGEQLCTKAHELSFATSQIAAELLTLDAKARWISQGVLDQLKLAGSVGSSIEAQRSRLEEQAKQWDNARALHSGNLDAILESLESQLVPPDFHESPTSSSLFGSQHSNSDGEEEHNIQATHDRSRWKTLRDFVHERGIEDASESMDDDRGKLDNVLALVHDFPQMLSERVGSLREELPPIQPLPSLEAVFHEQERLSITMAAHLESLASHYDQMAATLREKELGMDFSEDDLIAMNRDTDELPSIIADLEDDYSAIKSSHDKLETARYDTAKRISNLQITLEKLEELGGIMLDMLDQQQATETDFEIKLASLQSHLTNLEHLYMTYTSYQNSYNSLLIELDRRRRYRDITQVMLADMTRQLEARRNAEIEAREEFYAVHGPQLPDDLCLSIANIPTRYEVGTSQGEVPEEVPEIDEDLLEDAMKRIDLSKAGSESL